MGPPQPQLLLRSYVLQATSIKVLCIYRPTCHKFFGHGMKPEAFVVLPQVTVFAQIASCHFHIITSSFSSSKEQ